MSLRFSTRLAVIDAVAMSADRIVVASDNLARTYQVAGEELVEQMSVALPFVVERLWTSPSGRFLVARRTGGGELWIRDLERDQDSSTIVAPNPTKQQLVATVVSANERELVVCARSGSELEAYALDGGSLLWRADCETFRFADLVPIDGAGTLIAVGFFEGETKDSLSLIDLARVGAGPDVLFDQFRMKRGTVDYAYRLRAGPAGRNEFVGFRDPENDEDDLDRDADALHGFAGLYMRDVAGRVLSKVTWRAPLVGALAAGATWIAAQVRDEIHFISRQQPHDTRTVVGRWIASESDGTRILVERFGTFERFEL